MNKPAIDNGEEYISRAEMSPCGKYRHWLSRDSGYYGTMAFIMLNPSTADGEKDDATIRRCKSFARREGCGRIVVANLFTLRATKPRDLLDIDDPVGPDANTAIDRILKMTFHPKESKLRGTPPDKIVCAWGATPFYTGWFRNLRQEQIDMVLSRFEGLRPLYCLGKTQAGDPRHPLYVPNDQPLLRFK